MGFDDNMVCRCRRKTLEKAVYLINGIKRAQHEMPQGRLTIPNPNPTLRTLSFEAFGCASHNLWIVSSIIIFSQPIITPISSSSTSSIQMFCPYWSTAYFNFERRNTSVEPDAVSSSTRRISVEESLSGRFSSRPRRSSMVAQQLVEVEIT